MSFFTKYSRTLLTAAVSVAVSAGSAAAQNGSFADGRDGQKYKTVTIDKQVWMAENLGFKTGESWCYENNADNCKKYGRLYDWNTAMKACPLGWRLPSYQELKDLVTTVGASKAGKKLKSKSGWNRNIEDNMSGNGTDDFGFSALPGGDRNKIGNNFKDVGDCGNWWTATEGMSHAAYRMGMRYDTEYVDGVECVFDKRHGFSVRCVQNNP